MTSDLHPMKPEDALAHWQIEGALRLAPEHGLINRTWIVGAPPSAVLQWVNPIFHPRINLNIDAATRHLAERRFLTPRLMPTPDGRIWVDDEPGCWRLQTYVPGRTFERLRGPAQAAAAGALVGRFHAAFDDRPEMFHCPPRSIHNTPERIDELRAALDACDGHPLAGPARALGEEVFVLWEAWDGDLELPQHVCHGDLKISNVRFDEEGKEAICLIDLDTLEPMPFASELGDAWRSWCNPAGEDEPDHGRLDIELFAAAARAWLAEAPPLAAGELESLVPGLERIALELASRFAADAVRNDYFREDRERFPEPGRHNLVRARGQIRLVHSVRAQRRECEALLRASLP